MRFDKGFYLTFMVTLVFLLTIVAINAEAEEKLPVISEISTQSTSDPAQAVISRQLDAIHARDAALAWSLTTEEFREKYDSSTDYLSHLRFKLRPIYNHEDYKFISQTVNDNNMIQKVEMQNRYGSPVTVIYRLERKGGNWLIDSFAILPQDDAEAI